MATPHYRYTTQRQAPLSNKQGYELARIGTKHGLSVDLQRLIWADVTKNYNLRGVGADRPATLIQKYWRRMRKATQALPGRVAHSARTTWGIAARRMRVWYARDVYKRYNHNRVALLMMPASDRAGNSGYDRALRNQMVNCWGEYRLRLL